VSAVVLSRTASRPGSRRASSVTTREIDSSATPRASHAPAGGFHAPAQFAEGPGAGTAHAFESVDGGQTFKDISGNLPDVPVNDIDVVGGTIVLGTDLGVVAAERKAAGTPLRWSTLGRNLPAVTVMDVSTGPDGVLYAATHSRGFWGSRIR